MNPMALLDAAHCFLKAVFVLFLVGLVMRLMPYMLLFARHCVR